MIRPRHIFILVNITRAAKPRVISGWPVFDSAEHARDYRRMKFPNCNERKLRRVCKVLRVAVE